MSKIVLAGCVIEQDNKILLLYRTKRQQCELPGGKIEEQEEPQMAARRELQEELCCDVEIVKRLGEKEFEEDGFTMKYIWFLARLAEDQNPQIGEPDKHDHFRWISVNELGKYPLSPNVKNLWQELSK